MKKVFRSFVFIILFSSSLSLANSKGSDSVSASYNTTSTTLTGGAWTSIVFSNLVFDSYNAYQGGNFTCPTTGKYMVSTGLRGTGNWVSGNGFVVRIDLNGTGL